MTREEKIKKIAEKITHCLYTTKKTYEEIAADILVDIEFDEDQERWLEDEFVYDVRSDWFGLAQSVHKELRKKLDPKLLAMTIGARIKDAKWAAVDKNNMMFWYREEPVKQGDKYHCDVGDLCCDVEVVPYHIPCEVTDWTQARWELKELEE